MIVMTIIINYNSNDNIVTRNVAVSATTDIGTSRACQVAPILSKMNGSRLPGPCDRLALSRGGGADTEICGLSP